MSVKNLFIFDAIVCLFFGLGLISSPQALAKMFLSDPALSDGAVLTFRSYGIILFASGIALISARNALLSIARRGFLILIFISGTFIAIINIYAFFAGITSVYGWSAIVPTAIVAVWATLLLLKEKVSNA